MILVTVGMHYQGFPRLIKKMDQIASTINEEVIMQIGHTDYIPINCTYFNFDEYSELQKLTKKARIVVCHGGASIISTLELGVPVIAVPRLKKYEEVMDDHQLYFCKKLDQLGIINVVYDIDNLEMILKTHNKTQKIEFKRNTELIYFLKNYITQLQ
jgi:beta-1,4-N-acetylglucosaminyltransferase